MLINLFLLLSKILFVISLDNFQVNKSKWNLTSTKEGIETDEDGFKELYIENDENYYNNSLFERTKRAALSLEKYLWNEGVIPYKFDTLFSIKEIIVIEKAMKHWEKFTCIKFVKREYKHPNYIFITRLSCGCCSHVGMLGEGLQLLSIGKKFTKFGDVLHELGHAIGFWHEHARPDRDQFVKIIKKNIDRGQLSNFKKLPNLYVNSLHQPYDYNSIMHYSESTHAKHPGLYTILPLEFPGGETPKIGQRREISQGDIIQANLLYNCPVCGRTLLKEKGSFESPEESFFCNIQNYCEWRIHVANHERIVLNITSFNLYSDDYCEVDYLEIIDGYWNKSPILHRYCGHKKAPLLVSSTTNRLIVKYMKSSSGCQYYGFKANYETICGIDIRLDHLGYKELESPNYPENYQPNKECIWRVFVPENRKAALIFRSFELEYHINCRNDYVEIRDGNSSNSALIGRYCGSDIPTDVVSTGHELFIRFVSDAFEHKSGFSALLFTEINECKTSNHGCEHRCINTIGGYYCICHEGYYLHHYGKKCIHKCKVTLHEPKGRIISPSFPNIYPNNTHCIWNIIAPVNHIIILNFTYFQLEAEEGASKCNNNFVKVKSMFGMGFLQRHGKFCGSKYPTTIISGSHIMNVVFLSNGRIKTFGFSAIYFTKPDECIYENGGCHHVCHNTINSHVCSCANGFKLEKSGYSCIRDINFHIAENDDS